MKKNFTLLLLTFFGASVVSAQRLITEDFNYSTGDLVTVSGGVWTHLSGNTEPIQVVAGNLFYPGYSTSPVDSAKISLDSSTTNSENAFIKFTRQDTGTVYYSFLLKVRSNANLLANGNTQGEYFISFLNSIDNNTPIGAVVLKRGSVPQTFNLGIVPRVVTGATTAWASTDYNVNDTLLVTVEYQIIGGDNNNVASLWVNPALSVTPPTPDAQITDNDTGGTSRLQKLALYQRGNRAPVSDIDAIKISTTWNDLLLPLRLLSFSVINNNGYASLSWKTAEEVNMQEFEVQKSADAQNFLPIGHVPAINRGGNYTYSDPKQLAGTAFYRLKMIDNDGRYSYSAVVSINGKIPDKISVFPNPVVNNLVLSHPKAEAGAIIKVVSLNGTVIASYSVQKDAVQTSVDVSRLAKGNYIVVFQNAQQQQTIKVLKQ